MQFQSLLPLLGFFAIAGVTSAYYSDDGGVGIYARDADYEHLSLYARDDVDARDVHTAKIAARAAYNAVLFARAPIKSSGGRSPRKAVGKVSFTSRKATTSKTVSNIKQGGGGRGSKTCDACGADCGGSDTHYHPGTGENHNCG